MSEYTSNLKRLSEIRKDLRTTLGLKQTTLLSHKESKGYYDGWEYNKTKGVESSVIELFKINKDINMGFAYTNEFTPETCFVTLTVKKQNDEFLYSKTMSFDDYKKSLNSFVKELKERMKDFTGGFGLKNEIDTTSFLTIIKKVFDNVDIDEKQLLMKLNKELKQLYKEHEISSKELNKKVEQQIESTTTAKNKYEKQYKQITKDLEIEELEKKLKILIEERNKKTNNSLIQFKNSEIEKNKLLEDQKKSQEEIKNKMDGVAYKYPIDIRKKSNLNKVFNDIENINNTTSDEKKLKNLLLMI